MSRSLLSKETFEAVMGVVDGPEGSGARVAGGHKGYEQAA